MVGAPHFEVMMFTLPWPERRDCPGSVLSCDWPENQLRRGSLWLVLHESCRILDLNIYYMFLWQKRHDFNRAGSGSVFAKGTGSVAGVTFCLNYAMSS